MIRALQTFLRGGVLLALLTVAASAAPIITATKDDNLAAGLRKFPGNTITYTTTISNTGDATATAVQFADPDPANTGFVSVNSTPLARADSYSAIGNVQITIPAGSGVLANDRDADDSVNREGTLTASAGVGNGQVSLRSAVVAANHNAGSCRAGILNLGDGNCEPVFDDGVLSQAKLESLVGAAIARWEATGLTAEQVTLLRHVSFSVEELPGSALGQATPGRVMLDATAAGQRCFIDATPMDDAEFSGHGTQLAASGGRADALTAVMHELGHQLELEDSFVSVDRSNLMYGSVRPGERRLPAAHQAVGVQPHRDASCFTSTSSSPLYL